MKIISSFLQARGTVMTDNKTPNIDQPSDEAIAVAYAITRGSRQDEINRLDLKGINMGMIVR